MRILLTNDDGIYAPGLAAMKRSLDRLGEVYVIAPSKEQSGVSHSITFLSPLTVKRVLVDNVPWGWMVDGSPADCVKLGASQIMPEYPDLIVSGINGGLNAGINVLYSGTVGAAVEGAFYGITSVAVSLEYDENEPFHRAADLATDVIARILEKQPGGSKLYNLNLPLAALRTERPEVRIVGMDVSQYWETFEHRTDPIGRSYYWLTGRPDPRQPKKTRPEQLTDLEALKQGYITVTPLQYDMSDRAHLQEMEAWNLDPNHETVTLPTKEAFGPAIRTMRVES